MLAVTSSRAAYAAWWEAYEQSAAEQTDAAVRHSGDTRRDRDERDSEMATNGDASTTRPMTPDEALAVLRHGANDAAQAHAATVLAAELVALRAQRQAVLELTTKWENAGGCRLDAWATIRAVRLAEDAW